VELSKIPVESAEENKIYNETNINIHVDCSLAIDSKTKFTGQDEWGQRLAAKYTPPKQYEEYFKQVLNIMIPNSILKEIKKTDYRDLNTPFEIDFMANAANYAKKSDELFMFKVPCDLDSFLALATAAQSRSAPLFILYPRAMERKTVVEIPERYSIKSLPQNTSFDTPHLFFNIEFQPKGSKIIITENLTLSEREISEGRYPRFKNMIDKIRGIYGENIVLEEKKEKQESLGE
jgi:hypothetical protein